MKGIEKRGENSYRLIVYDGYDKQGKQIRKTKTIDLSHLSSPKKQMAEAEKQRILFEEEIKKGHYIDNEKITFEEFIEKWLTTYANHNLQPKTLLEYKRLLGRIIPALGHIKLIQLQPTHFMEFYNNLRENGIKLNKRYTTKANFIELISKSGFSLKDIILKTKISESVVASLKYHKNIQPSTALKISDSLGLKIGYLFDEVLKDEPLSEKTILHHHRLISTILSFAVQNKFLLSNPAGFKAPKVQKKEARHFTPEQTEYILELIENKPLKYRVMITLAIYGGMRQGELTALTWDDIDFNNYRIAINKSLQHLPGKETFIKSTKTETNRTITVPKAVMTLLKEYKVWQNGERANLGDLWYDSNFLFTAIYGKPIFPSTISKWFLKFIRQHNEDISNDNTISKEDKIKYILPEVNFHGLRHTSATLLIALGTDVVTVSRRLGHSKTSTTTDIYAHSLQKSDMEAANKLENLFNKSTQNIKQG